ncbi:nitrilase [Pseudoclavibacter endophyticus]|uniref:Carbon-nitrogen hydrolase family protein n=1 Tax=Pseudoclavibacter endophyticus TaxID=1778590 RepID=A0A6H9WB88_9MICO|nr:carbon-nitrogen hydrolase family protein [Pseudoclavibacter endophyticus]KAB1647863.1 carbon-nitrogen hydrolase family protein [Pseudoclavibacter endophyticus]GGA73409.1 nitrilase [Pseudoclavibacter endophyticus]
MTSTIRIAAVQAEPVWLEMEATTEKTIRLIEEAGAGGARLVAFPETWIPGYPVFLWSYPVFEQAPFVARYHANSPAADGPELRSIREAARRARVTVVVGFSEKDAGSLFMSQQLIGPDGEVLQHRRKLKPTHAERTLFGEGDGSDLAVVDSPVGRLGALNCFEHLQPLTKYAMYAQNEQVHVAGWPCLGILGTVPALSPDALLATTLTYALEGGTFVAMATQIMSDEGARAFPTADGGPTPVYTGGGGFARVYGPDSSLLTEPLDPMAEGIVYADIDLAAIDLAKNTVDPAGHYARPDATQLVLNQQPRRPVLRPRDLDSTFASAPRQDASAPSQDASEPEAVSAVETP